MAPAPYSLPPSALYPPPLCIEMDSPALGEEKGLSWPLLPARGGTCPTQAWTQTFLSMGTAGSDVSLTLEPAFPRASLSQSQPHRHCHGAARQRCRSSQPLSLTQVFAKDTSLVGTPESWAQAWVARFLDTSEYFCAIPEFVPKSCLALARGRLLSLGRFAACLLPCVPVLSLPVCRPCKAL